MMTYLVLQGPRIGANASLVATTTTPEAALRAARQWQHAESARSRKPGPCWVERDDGCILGGTYPWVGNAEHARRAEHLNWARGFAGYPPSAMGQVGGFGCAEGRPDSGQEPTPHQINNHADELSIPSNSVPA